MYRSDGRADGGQTAERRRTVDGRTADGGRTDARQHKHGNSLFFVAPPPWGWSQLTVSTTHAYTGKALKHGSMCFPQYELCIGMLQTGQGQKSETNG